MNSETQRIADLSKIVDNLHSATMKHAAVKDTLSQVITDNNTPEGLLALSLSSYTLNIASCFAELLEVLGTVTPIEGD